MSKPEHNKFNINDYDVYHTTRKNKRGGDVALYVKQELACTFLSYKSLVVDDLFESCSIAILLSGHRNIIVSSINRCPGSKTYTNKLNSILRTAEKEYYSKLLMYAKGNIRSTWKILNAVINTKTNTSKLASHYECNGINIVSKQSIADEFNNFFVDVGSNLAKMITVADNACCLYI